MHHSRLVWTALALWATAGTTTLALACDNAKSAQASAVTAAVSGSGSSACKAHGATAAKMADGCTAEMAAACKAHGATAGMDHCNGKGASATSAALNGRTPNSVDAVFAGSGAACNHGTSAKSAAKSGACSGEGMASMARGSRHADCDACVDMVKCSEQIEAAGGRSQIVPLKNGVMIVYTAETAEGIRAIKSAVAERNERMAIYTSSGDKAHLCSQCKSMRGAAASGKLTREVVSIEGGCLTLMTSTDTKIVAQLHSMTGVTASRVKS